jgi:ABC-2 type transport system permease protein
MWRGLLKLTWLELKIFLREPLGAAGTIVVPVVIFIVLGRLGGSRLSSGPVVDTKFLAVAMPVLVSVLIAISAVLSLVTVISVYREGGILKRLRATPLRPPAILLAQVLVKLLLTAATLALTVLAGRRFYSVGAHVPLAGFTVALLISTASILSIGFVIASLVPTARFAQPVGAVLLYPMIAVSGLFFPVAVLPPALRVIAGLLPVTYAVSLLQGIWTGESWVSHAGDIFALGVICVACVALSARIFRWE